MRLTNWSLQNLLIFLQNNWFVLFQDHWSFFLQEYDFEDAQIVDSNLTEEDIKVFQRRKAAKSTKSVTPTPVQAEAAEDSGPRFQSKRKVEDKMEKDSQSAAKKMLKYKTANMEQVSQRRRRD